jgi:predicted glycosyltransferase
MERRNRSIESLNRLVYVDSLDNDELKAKQLADWVEQNLVESSIEEFDLELNDLKKLSELIYKNLNFLKNYRQELKAQMNSSTKIKKFLQ